MPPNFSIVERLPDGTLARRILGGPGWPPAEPTEPSSTPAEKTNQDSVIVEADT